MSDLSSDTDHLPPRRLQIAQLLIAVGFVDLAAIPIDHLLLDQHFGRALALRLSVVPPIVLAGLALYRFSRNMRAAVLATALAILSLVIVGAVIGQFASEPQSSRYVMATLFVLFGAALSASLPWRITHWMTATAALAVAAIVATGLRSPPQLANLDLALFSIVAATGALLLRRRRIGNWPRSSICACAIAPTPRTAPRQPRSVAAVLHRPADRRLQSPLSGRLPRPAGRIDRALCRLWRADDRHRPLQAAQ
ncbi:MAG: hypothetical protein MZV49_06550 [Rhodopseudomonas palustris]|nr:hypothetical protein [Rhodopseudomonas palustris]